MTDSNQQGQRMRTLFAGLKRLSGVTSRPLINGIQNVRRRRVHVWAALYFIAIWNFVEPMTAYFGLTDQTIEVIRNLGIAGFPLVLVLAWYHGEPGPQRFTRSEFVSLTAALIIGGGLYGVLSRAPWPEYTVLTSLNHDQESWFQQRVLNPFGEHHRVRVRILSYDQGYDHMLTRVLEGDTAGVLLVEVPLHLTGALMKPPDRRIVAYQDVIRGSSSLTFERLRHRMAQSEERLLSFGRDHKSRGELYLLPGSQRCNVMVYARSKVEDLVAGWPQMRAAADSALFALVGLRLPDDFQVERDVGAWDCFDLFVAAWYWSRRTYQGVQQPRLALPCARTFDAFSCLLDRALAFGADLDDIFDLASHGRTPHPEPIAEMMLWDAIFAAAGLFSEHMWLGEGLRVGEIAGLLRRGVLFMAFLPNQTLYEFSTAEDLAVAPLPRSILGTMAGKRAGFADATFWAIPRKSPAYELSYLLAEWLTEERIQRIMYERLARMPVHPGLLGEMLADSADGPSWRPALEQLTHTAADVVAAVNPYKDFDRVDNEILIKFYHQKWHEVMRVRDLLTGDYQQNIQDILAILTLPTISGK